MSVLEGSVPCVPQLAEAGTENNDIVNSDSASVLDAETVQNTNTLNSHVDEETLNDSDLLKGLLTDSFCQVCEAVLLFESQRVSHYEGKKHAQRVRIYLQTKKAERNKQKQEFGSFQHGNVDPEKLCELCNMVFSSPVVARSHYEGKVHAKNMRKSSTTPYVADVRSTVRSPVMPAPTGHGAPRGEADQGPKESTVPNPHGVDLDDTDKYCKMCTVSFNNPIMARQHYSGRKHQRNQARQELLCRLGEESEHVHSLTCPVCCVTLSSIETYQAHMQGNKHHIQEKKIVGLCKSQKKVYDSFQDELADYIQVQRARGLEPKTGQGSEAPAHSTAEEKAKDTVQDVEETLPSAPLSHAPPPSLHPPQWHQPFTPQLAQFALRGTFPMQKQWNQGYPSHPPPLIPGLTGRSLHRGRSPISSSSSSFSDSSSSYSSSSGSSSISSSEDSRGRRRRRRKRRDGARSRREQDDGSAKDADRRQSKRRSRKEGEEERGDPRKVRRHRRMSFEEEQGEQGVDEDPGRRKEKDKGARGRDSDDGEDHGRKRRAGKRNKRQKEGLYGKRWREEGVGEWSKGSADGGRVEGGGLDEGMPATVEDHLRGRPEDERAKCKREKKKKTKDKNDEGDARTEEEKLWDETILGLF